MKKTDRNALPKRTTPWRGGASTPKGILDKQLCFALYAASRAAMGAYRLPLAELGLTYPRYLVMLALWDEDDIPISTLGERLFLDFGTLSPLLKKLAADKLITRVRDTADERIVRAVLTTRGRNLRSSVNCMQSDLACRLGFSPSTVIHLRKRLWMLLRDLANIKRRELATNIRQRRPRIARLSGTRVGHRIRAAS